MRTIGAPRRMMKILPKIRTKKTALLPTEKLGGEGGGAVRKKRIFKFTTPNK